MLLPEVFFVEVGAVTKPDNISCLGPSRDLARCKRVRGIGYLHPGAFQKMFRNGGMVVMVLDRVSGGVAELTGIYRCANVW